MARCCVCESEEANHDGQLENARTGPPVSYSLLSLLLISSPPQKIPPQNQPFNFFSLFPKILFDADFVADLTSPQISTPKSSEPRKKLKKNKEK
jgi:hypothetical protein